MPLHTSPVISYVTTARTAHSLCKEREKTQGAIPGYTDALLGGDGAGRGQCHTDDNHSALARIG